MSTKYEIAKRLSENGGYHRTFDRLWSLIPDKVKDRCSPAVLAELADIMKDCYDDGYEQGYKDAMQ